MKLEGLKILMVGGVNVFGWKKKYGFYTERRSPKDKFPKVTNLLCITDDNLNFHYILITNLARLHCVLAL